MLTFYELDLGLNHVTRKLSEPVDPNANMLIPVFGGSDGPGGVLVCAENWIIYMNEVCSIVSRAQFKIFLFFFCFFGCSNVPPKNVFYGCV